MPLSKMRIETLHISMPGESRRRNTLRTLNSLHEKDEGKERMVAPTLDMSKAYYRVEWGLVVMVMKFMGFPEKM